MIGTVNQEDSYIMETLNTLNFISKAKKIDINPKMNFQTKSESANKKYISELLETIGKLEDQNKALARQNADLKSRGQDPSKDKLEKMRVESQQLRRQITDLRGKMQKMVRNLEEKKRRLRSMREKEKKKATSDLKMLKIESALNYLQPQFKAKRVKNKKHTSLAKKTPKMDKISSLSKRNKSTNLGKRAVSGQS